MKTFTIIIYSDPAHAWGKVKRQVLLNLGIAELISPYSYQYKDNVYLEEDCDLPMIYSTLMALDTRIKFVEKRSKTSSRIRSYDSYSAQPAIQQ